MNNFDVAREALETSMNSDGSASRELEKWQESLEARILKLKASWQGLSQTFMSSDFLKFALDLVTTLVKGLDKLIDTFGVLGTVIGGFTIFRSFSKNNGMFDNIFKVFRLVEDDASSTGKKITSIFNNSLSNISFGINADSNFKEMLANDMRALFDYRDALKAGIPETEAFSMHMTKASASAQDYAKNTDVLSDGVLKFARQQKTANITLQAQDKSFSSVKSILNEYNTGCKNTAMSQEDFIKSVSSGNAALGNYLTGLNGGTASMKGYAGALAKTIGLQIVLQAATTALNVAITMGVSFLISKGISAITKFINREKDLAESVDELTSKYKEQYDQLMKNKSDFDTSNEDSLASKYEKLSKGVDSLGRNVSLTTDEYSEYQSVVNSIAEQIPSLVSGYDSQGNAILSCAGNVDKLTEAYERLIHEQNKEVLDKSDDIEKDFGNAIKDISAGDADKGILGTGDAEALEKMLNGGYSEKQIKEVLAKGTASRRAIVNALKNQGLAKDIKWSSTSEDYDKAIADAIKTDPEKVRAAINEYETNLESELQGLRTEADAALSEAFDISSSNYYDMSDTMKNIISQVVDGFDVTQFRKIINNGQTVEEYINGMLSSFERLEQNGDSKKLEAVFDLQTKFNNGEVSYGEYVNSVKEAKHMIDGLRLDDEVKEQLNITLNTDEVIDNYSALMERLTSKKYPIKMDEEKAKEFLDGLSASEYSVAVDLIASGEVDLSDFDANSLRDYIQKQAKLQEAMNFTIGIDVETEELDKVNTAIQESVSATGLSSESISVLKSRYADLESQGYNLSQMFEETSNGIHLNKKAFSELEQAYASQKLNEADSSLNTLKDRYDELTESIKNCNDPAEKSKLILEQQNLSGKISEIAELATQYKGLASAYQAWQNMEGSGSERDMYEGIIEGFENVDDEISRGWIDDGTIKFLELLTGRTDLATKSGKELKEVYNNLDKTIGNSGYSVRDFFTVDDDGNSTNTGVYNFLETVETFEDKLGDVIKRDENGNIISFDFEVAGGDKAIADALGISEELVQIMVRAADDAGFVVNMDGTYTQYANLANEATAANQKLKELSETNKELKEAGGDFDFDFNTTNVTDVQSQLEKAKGILDTFKTKDGSINLKAEGAQEAMTIVSTLQARLDSLTSEKYGIGLTVEDKKFEEPLEKLQEYGHTIASLNQLEINPKANEEEIKVLKEDLNDIAEYFSGLDKETKIKLGFEEEDGIDEIKKKIESGEVKIPTTLDIQTNMNESLEDLRDLALLNSGILSDDEEKEIEKKFKIKIKADEVDDSDVEDKTDKAVNDEGKSKKKTEKTTDIKLEADNVDTSNVDSKIDEAIDSLDLDEETKLTIKALAKVFGVEDVKELQERLDGLDDKQIETVANVLGRVDVEKLKTSIDGLDDREVELIANALGKGSIDDLRLAIFSIPDQKKVKAIANAFGFSDVQSLKDAMGQLTDKDVQAIAQAFGITDVNSLRNAIDRLTNKDVNAVAHASGKGDVDNLKTSIDNLKDKSVVISVIASGIQAVKDAIAGIGGVDGTAHVNGTAFVDGTTGKSPVRKSGKAFKQGSWGTKGSGIALGGELGTELLVRDGRWYTIGENSAEFFGYKKGDIIFNADQTREIFEKGKITHGNGRGKALASGTAFSKGTGGIGKVGGYSSGYSSSSKSSSNKSSSSSSSSDAEEFEETLDWIEIAIDRIERAIDSLDLKASSVYKTWSNRNNALVDEISKVGDEISLQQKAYERYLQQANSIGLSEEYTSKVRNGTIDIETITDEDLNDKISEYQTWYEKAIACQKAIEDLKETEAELYKQRFDNVASEYDGILGVIEHEKNMLEEYINQSEAQAWLVSSKYYSALADNERDNITQLKKEKASMLSELEDAMESGTIAKNSEAWFEMINAIDEVTLSIEESNTKLLEYKQTIQQLSWETFDLLQDKISNITDETEFLIDLMSNKELYDDNGQLTNEGSSTMGLHGVAYNVNMAQADKYAKEAERLKKELEKDPYDTELEERYREMISLQREHILAAEDEKEAIRDMVEEGIEKELDALQERIDKYNEALDSQKDLYDYQKKVKEQTEEIASLEKQMASYSNDTSEEAKAKVQELKVSLEEAKAELQETEYDRYISDQQQLLDDLYEEYETILNTRLDNIDALISDMIEEINSNSSVIGDTIRESADSVGYELSDSMQTIWSTNTGDVKNVITTYGDKFSSAQTTTNNALNTINTNLQNMITQLNKIAKTNIKSASTSSAKDSSQANAEKKEPVTQPKPPTPSTTTKAITVGGKINAGSAPIYDYAGDTSGERQYFSSDPIYTVLKEQAGYLLTRWHKLSSGYTGWFKKSDVKAYKTGKKIIDSDDMAWTQEGSKQEYIVRPSDGAILTPVAKKDSVLNANASNNIWNMANSPAEFIKDNLKLDASNIPNNSNVQNNFTQNLDKVVFNLPNVKNYNELLSTMQKDKNFERLILSMSVDRIAGKSSLAKNKVIR